MKPLVGVNLLRYKNDLVCALEFVRSAKRRVFKAYGSSGAYLNLRMAETWIEDGLKDKYEHSGLRCLIPPQTRKVRRMESRHD